ncbi:hypothetical protein [Tuwongella immobilis]|uniref:AsmA-like C-terminal domain-containing protein n=1 Tax=Tuwongella immobilis TaxID=692036 RepID=A0A6C2YJ85_9BACT|nr:hypothetical protein [Tuwongella immobilis]VIP01299.1 Uncharacterized protein OS=Singulisphaera acidiphila (strain ATCC BAA-1392 / DSM 18658 / VKM B-2454 / MOB10) GN=Sinac_1031 PE=4 SV=1 [Tuwongella immobilis]VTR98024.1 Uncharacterized protein OS=Singulisphaera acidiphila (strain ATCC BAA-1392 / DSM 18658 / VKM B-2454 / MOB10) GN=Sinac_1031 PE=4 SV=1 [Tuwongella immobilis]
MATRMPIILGWWLLMMLPMGRAQPIFLPISTIEQTIDLEAFLERLQIDTPVCVTGEATFRGSAKIPVGLNPDWRQAEVRGTVSVPELRLNDFTLADVQAAVLVRGGSLILRQLSARLPAGGRVRGDVSVGISPATLVNTTLHFEELRAGYIAEQLAFPQLTGLQGHAKGLLQMSWPMGTPPTLDHVRLTVEGQTLRYGPWTIGAPKIVLEPHDKGLRYDLSADTLGGKVSARGYYPTPNSISAGGEPGDCQIEVDHIEMDRIWRLLGWNAMAGNWFGLLSGDLVYRHQGEQLRAVGEGHLQISSLRWRSRVLTSSLGCLIQLENRVLTLNQLKLGLGHGGLLHAKIDWYNPERSRLQLQLYRMPLDQLLAPISSELAGASDLPMDVHVDTTLGTHLRGSASLTMPRGKLFRLTVHDLRCPIRWSITPTNRRGLIEIPDFDAIIAQGRIEGRLLYRHSLGGDSKLSGWVSLLNVHGNSIIRVLSGTGPSAGGPISGRIEFSAEPMQSLNDLSGIVKLRAERLYLFQAPVFRELGRRIGPNASPQTAIDQLELRAVVANGFVRLQRFSCAAETVQLYVDGTLAMDGRIRLGLTGSSGRKHLRSAIGPALGLSIPLSINPISAAVVIQLSRIIAQHTLQAEITGTVQAPRVVFHPLEMLTEEAVRFFLDQGDIGIR